MAFLRKLFIFFLYLMFCCSNHANANDFNDKIFFRYQHLTGKFLKLSNDLDFVFDKSVDINLFKDTVYNKNIFNKWVDESGTIENIYFTSENIQNINKKFNEALLFTDGFVIVVRENVIIVQSKYKSGFYQALNTLELILYKNNFNFLPEGVIADWPSYSNRILHFDLLDLDEDNANKLIYLARINRYNTVILQVSDRVSFPGFEYLAHKRAWDREKFIRYLNFIRKNCIDIVPEVKLLTHQEKFLKETHNEYLYNKVTYNPSIPELYEKIIFPFLKILIRDIHPSAILIGHDEVAGWNDASLNKWMNKGEKPLPPELFLNDVVTVNKFINEYNSETWIWGDSLLSIKEFPQMLPRHLHAFGEYSRLIGKIPKNIVILDWHYFDIGPEYPSMNFFVENGYNVIGGTWKKNLATKNFSRYALGFKKGVRGMVATTWYHVQWKEWEVVKNIIDSGLYFWNPNQYEPSNNL